MPTFDFTCNDCETTFEFNRPFGSKIMPACSKCSSTNVQKKFHTPNIAFKGSGFYVTDTNKNTSTSGTSENTAKPTKSEPAPAVKKAN